MGRRSKSARSCSSRTDSLMPGCKANFLPLFVRAGDSGLLVPPESPAAVAEALIRVLGDYELQERLARNGRQVADQHSWPSIAERTESAFARLVEN